MKYVLDSCVGFKWALIEVDTFKARRLRDDYRNGIHQLLAPDIFIVEIAHSLTRAERQQRITPAQGAQALFDVMQTLPQLVASLPLLVRAYAISSQARIGLYDCLYVALAERERCPLISADDKLLRNLQSQFPFLVPLASFP